MISHVLLQVSIYLLIAFICGGIGILVLATWHDFAAIGRRRAATRSAKKLTRPRQPSIAVLVYTHNNAATLTQCLRSITRSQYHNYDITVIDNHSTDASKQVVQQFIHSHTRAAIRLYAKRQFTTRTVALRKAYRRHRSHDFVLVLNGSDMVAPDTLKQCAARFVIQDSLGNLILPRLSAPDYTISSLVPKFSELTRHLLLKAFSHLLRRQLKQRLPVGMYRHEIFMQPRSAAPQARYEDSLAVTRLSADTPTYSRRATCLCWIAAVGIVILMTHLLIIASLLMSATYLLLSWVALTLWLLYCIWATAAIRLSERLRLSYSASLAFLLIYVQLAYRMFVIPARLLAQVSQPGARKLSGYIRYKLATDFIVN